MPALEADIALPNAVLTCRPDHFHAPKNPKQWIRLALRIAGEAGLSRGELIDNLRLREAHFFPGAILALRESGWIDERDRRLYLLKRSI